jgi:hypothetical protein
MIRQPQRNSRETTSKMMPTARSGRLKFTKMCWPEETQKACQGGRGHPVRDCYPLPHPPSIHMTAQNKCSFPASFAAKDGSK